MIVCVSRGISRRGVVPTQCSPTCRAQSSSADRKNSATRLCWSRCFTYAPRLAQAGRQVFDAVGCGSCHIPDLRIERDRRVADVETRFDPVRGVLNRLFATASLRLVAIDDGSGFPSQKRPAREPFAVRNFFADLKRHDLGPASHERNYDGTTTTQFMTEPLWGVGSTSPYGHDGRSISLREVILRHGGEARRQRDAFAAMPEVAQLALFEFLESLVLFPPDDTASNLDPGDPGLSAAWPWEHQAGRTVQRSRGG